MSIKFIHRRYITAPTEQDVAKGRKFSLSCKGGITVGYKWDDTTKKIKLATARCAMEENFNRRIARDIVCGRVESKKPGRNTEIDLSAMAELTPQKVEDIVWGWLENQERLWDAVVLSHSVH